MWVQLVDVFGRQLLVVVFVAVAGREIEKVDELEEAGGREVVFVGNANVVVVPNPRGKPVLEVEDLRKRVEPLVWASRGPLQSAAIAC